MKQFEVGLVGCGRISQRHVEAIGATPGIRIAQVCDIDEPKAKKVATALEIPWTTDLRTLQGLDAISILTPSGMHPRHCMDVANHCDTKYIICEKPISLTVREAVEMLREVERCGKKLLPVYQNRYNQLVQFTHQLIHSGKLGRVFQFVCNVFWNRNDEYFGNDWHGTLDLDGGVLYTQASHYVDMIHYLFGEISNSKGFGGHQRGFAVHDTVSAVCEFRSGVIGTINATVSTWRQNYLTEFTVLAEKGTVRLSGTNLNQIDFWDVDGMEKPNIDFKLDHIYGKGHDAMYQYLVDGRFDVFPSYDDVLSGIALMQRLSY